jgi:type IV secretory pathway VirB10-like protein
MSENNNRFRGLVVTIGFHLLVLLALLYFALSTPLPLPGEEGVEVNLGSSRQGMGVVQELSPPPVERPQRQTPPPQTDPDPEPEEDLITQEVEEAPAIRQEDIKDKEKPREEEKPVDPDDQAAEEEVVQEEEPEPEPPKVIERALYRGSSQTSGDGSNEGITGQPGDQGDPNGTPAAAAYEGQGGQGEGVGYDLGGRGVKHLPKPAYDSEEQGKVVVEIRVDRSGKVVSAMAGARGTTITDLRLRRLAEEAALRSVFASDPNAPERQRGTITYNFIRLN